MDNDGEQQLLRDLQTDFGMDSEAAAGTVSLAKKVAAREGHFSLEGLARYARDAAAQDPLLRLYLDGGLPDFRA
jgi:hypothetical protein